MSASADVAGEVLLGAIDVYVHSSPDPLARRLDDLDFAAELKRDGFRAAVHRHHFSATAERARVASDATGFEVIGAVLLNGTAGGLNPLVVNLALEMGARWVSMPTLSGRAYQAGANANPYSSAAVAMIGTVPVLGDNGELVPTVHEILNLVAASDVVLSLGYISFSEAMAVVRDAQKHRVRKIVATNPATIMNLSIPEMTELISFPEVTFEFAASSAQPFLGGTPSLPPSQLVDLVRRFGVARCMLSSDSGHTGAPTTYELLSSVCSALADEGLSAKELRSMVRDTPARLLGVMV